MTEDFLQYVWKFALFDRSNLTTDTGEPVEIIRMGEHNTDAGPDFVNARIKIGNTTWAGNVEIHLRSSDWNAHHHQHDRAYDNVILHVVYRYDQPVLRNNGEVLPTIILGFDDKIYSNYELLVQNKRHLPCQDRIGTVDQLIIELWLNSLIVDRLQDKTSYIQNLLAQYRNNWEEVFYIMLARAFGFGLNAVPFELTARSMPLHVLARHRNNSLQVEALLMGQAGFLNEGQIYAGYYTELRNEYLHLRHKYGLRPVEQHLWKFLRLRPVNFPTVRMAQYSALSSGREGFFSLITGCRSLEEACSLLDVRASSFWNTHYTFETPSADFVKRIGTESIHILIMNAVVPLLFIYGKINDREEMKDRALDWLNGLPAEKNRVVNRWTNSGMHATSALQSQAILQLFQKYCNKKRCLACAVGTQIIQTEPF